MGGVDKELPKVGIASLSDVELGVLIAGLITSWDKPKGGTDLTALAKATGIFKGQDER
jgi:hypothetical protein